MLQGFPTQCTRQVVHIAIHMGTANLMLQTQVIHQDFWAAYSQVFPEATHPSVGKDSGETNHMERWNNILRQRNARYVWKTLSFSKSDFYHKLVTRIFIVEYNQSISLAT